MIEQKLRDELAAAFKNRALIYYTIFNELRQEVGEEKAVAILKRAIYRRGEQIGQQFRQFAPRDFEGLKDSFLEIMPDEGRLFSPNVVRCDSEALDIQLETCPLKQIWEELGLEEREKILMCEIAGEIDKGTFEGAGFSFQPDTWQPGRSGCCHLHIRASSSD